MFVLTQRMIRRKRIALGPDSPFNGALPTLDHPGIEEARRQQDEAERNMKLAQREPIFHRGGNSRRLFACS